MFSTYSFKNRADESFKFEPTSNNEIKLIIYHKDVVIASFILNKDNLKSLIEVLIENYSINL
jgi:hypothetical protein